MASSSTLATCECSESYRNKIKRGRTFRSIYITACSERSAFFLFYFAVNYFEQQPQLACFIQTIPPMMSKIGQVTSTNHHVKMRTAPSKKSTPVRIVSIGSTLWCGQLHVLPCAMPSPLLSIFSIMLKDSKTASTFPMFIHYTIRCFSRVFNV
jgi:hypothetical protein